MEKTNQPALINGTVVRAILVLLALASFALAAGAPICIMC